MKSYLKVLVFLLSTSNKSQTMHADKPHNIYFPTFLRSMNKEGRSSGCSMFQKLYPFLWPQHTKQWTPLHWHSTIPPPSLSTLNVLHEQSLIQHRNWTFHIPSYATTFSMTTGLLVCVISIFSCLRWQFHFIKEFCDMYGA